MRGAFVKTVATRKDETPPQVKKFNIIVASFKQLFNARSVCERLEAAGYDGAAVLIDRDEQYFVSAASYANLDSAVTSLRAIQQNPPLPIRQPFPYILDKAR